MKIALKNYVLMLLCSTMITGCNKEKQHTQKEANFDKLTPDGSLRIHFKWATITARARGNDITFEHWGFRDSLTNAGEWHIPTNREVEKAKLSASEKDSMYVWVKKMVEKPVKPKNFCSDYVGYVSLAVMHSAQIQQSCTYSSVCDWRFLSAESQKLNSLIKSKFRGF